MKFDKQTDNLDRKQYSIYEYNKTLIIIQLKDVVFI